MAAYCYFNNEVDAKKTPERFVGVIGKLQNHRKTIRKQLIKIIHKNFEDEENIQTSNILEYAVLSSARYYRSFLIKQFANLLDIDTKKTNFIASIIEMYHSYLTMSSDAPSLDNEDFRNDRETCHKKFGECQTYIASNEFILFIFEYILNCEDIELTLKERIKIGTIFSKNVGRFGFLKAKMMEQTEDKKYISEKDVVSTIHRLKIHALYDAGLESLEIISSKNKSEKKAIKMYLKYMCNMLDKYEQLTKEYNCENIETLISHSKVLLDQINKSLDIIKTNNTETDNQEENNTKKTDTIQTLRDFAEYNYYCIEQIANKGKRSLYDFNWWKHQELQSSQQAEEQISASNL